MNRERVIETLREHEAELKASGILRLCVFGSVARGEATLDSDVDLLAEFDPERQHTLISLGGLEYRLTEWLGTKAELSSAQWMKAPVRERALREAVVAF